MTSNLKKQGKMYQLLSMRKIFKQSGCRDSQPIRISKEFSEKFMGLLFFQELLITVRWIVNRAKMGQ